MISHVWSHLCVDQFACSQCQYRTGYGKKSAMTKHIMEICNGAEMIDRSNEYQKSIDSLYKMCFPDIVQKETSQLVENVQTEVVEKLKKVSFSVIFM